MEGAEEGWRGEQGVNHYTLSREREISVWLRGLGGERGVFAGEL